MNPEAVDLRQVHLYAVVPNTEATHAVLASLEEADMRKDQSARYRCGVLLSDAEAVPFYASFHIVADHDLGEHDGAEATGCFIHATFARAPSSPPPPGAMRRRAAGKTLQWFAGLLTTLVNSEQGAPVLVDATLGVDTADEPKGRVAAPPLAVGEDVLEVSGVEYRKKHPAGPGLHRFRWSRRGPDRLVVELSYGFLHDGREVRPWLDEKTRCVDYLRTLL